VELAFLGAGILLGTITGLVPGLHSTLILLLLAGSLSAGFGPVNTAVFIISAACTGIYTHCLAGTFHPVASTNMDGQDPVLRMTSKGKGLTALRLQIDAIDSSMHVITIIVAILATLSAIVQGSLLEMMQSVIKPMAIVVIFIWIIYTCVQSKNAILTFLGLMTTGLYGYIVLHHPLLRGNEHSLLPILNGLIAIPMLVTAMMDTKSRIKKQFKLPIPEMPRDLAVIGALVGSSTGFLAGLGTSSFITLFTHKLTSDEKYVYASAAAQAANSITAILLIMTLGIGRSGEAVLLGRIVPSIKTEPITIALLVVCMVASLAAGSVITKKITMPYIQVAQKLPIRMTSGFLLVMSVFSLTLVGNHTVAVLATIPGVIISLICRKLELPQQVMFGCLAIPLVFYYLDLVPTLNNLFGL
jgi:putative membrane protein